MISIIIKRDTYEKLDKWNVDPMECLSYDIKSCMPVDKTHVGKTVTNLAVLQCRHYKSFKNYWPNPNSS